MNQAFNRNSGGAVGAYGVISFALSLALLVAKIFTKWKISGYLPIESQDENDTFRILFNDYIKKHFKESMKLQFLQ